jgi:hypothetical protein
MGITLTDEERQRFDDEYTKVIKTNLTTWTLHKLIERLFNERMFELERLCQESERSCDEYAAEYVKAHPWAARDTHVPMLDVADVRTAMNGIKVDPMYDDDIAEQARVNRHLFSTWRDFANAGTSQGVDWPRIARQLFAEIDRLVARK